MLGKEDLQKQVDAWSKEMYANGGVISLSDANDCIDLIMEMDHAQPAGVSHDLKELFLITQGPIGKTIREPLRRALERRLTPVERVVSVPLDDSLKRLLDDVVNPNEMTRKAAQDKLPKTITRANYEAIERYGEMSMNRDLQQYVRTLIGEFKNSPMFKISREEKNALGVLEELGWPDEQWKQTIGTILRAARNGDPLFEKTREAGKLLDSLPITPKK
jgi:hypothetical protein